MATIVALLLVAAGGAGFLAVKGVIEGISDSRRTPAPDRPVGLPAGPPEVRAMAVSAESQDAKPLRLQMPVSEQSSTGIGFYHRPDNQLVALKPQGTRANIRFYERFTRKFFASEQAAPLRYWELDRGEPNAVIIGAMPNAEVWSPVTGTITAITDDVLNGEVRGQFISIQPLGDIETLVMVRGVSIGTDLSVGSGVTEGATMIGQVSEAPDGTKSPLSKFTHDSGSGIDVYIRHVGSTGGGLG